MKNDRRFSRRFVSIPQRGLSTVTPSGSPAGAISTREIHAQAAMIAGDKNSDSLKKLQKIGELLQFDADASAYLMAEFRLKRMVGDVYKILADAVDIDLGPLEA